MSNDNTTASWEPGYSAMAPQMDPLALVIVGAAHDPARLGEIAFLPGVDDPPGVIGRHGTVQWSRHRPDGIETTGPLVDPVLSREQLHLVGGSSVSLRCVGRLPLYLNGRPVSECPVRLGDVLAIADRYLFLVARRPRELSGVVESSHVFGGADSLGWVGESPEAWRMRAQIGFIAARNAHVLVTGPSGSGKELVAQGLHRRSTRRRQTLVSRNAATIPTSLADAELFGNVANYPNPGMASRPGLVGEADGSTLFLDEFGELPIEVQARLLRVLDDGEYTRLGDAKPRRADLRLVAATNRDPATLKHDVRARLGIHIEVPALNARPEDIPLLAVHLLRRIASDDPELAHRFFVDGHPQGAPRISMGLMRQLLVHPYQTHVRELEALLWRSISSAQGDELPELSDAVAPQAPVTSVVSGPVDPASLDPQTIQAALDRHGGRQEPVWKELNLASRYVLSRLVKKHGLRVRGRS
ncbi:MAG: sigma 54-interacting transcriptional regulator [Myxococcota bacterium]